MINTPELINSIKNLYGSQVTSADIRAYCVMNNLSYQTITKRLEDYKESRGRWNLEITQENVNVIERSYELPTVENTKIDSKKIEILDEQEECLIPDKDKTFVKFGNFTDIKKIIESGIFYPTFITGLSGNGKTFSVEQACAQLGRELVRVNITVETDEDDLIGGFRLINGETVWHNGPVIKALTRGAILLLDEIDLASNKILCLQSILEGKGIFLKKIGKYVQPSPGFNIIATANTKGKGSDDGRFIGTNVLNEAFLERFAITFEQEYPTVAVETRILKTIARDIGLNEDSDTFCENLANWGDLIRKTFYEGAIDEIVSTRRLVHIIKAYKIFDNKKKSIKICLNRFDDETKDSFIEFYEKIDEENSKKIPEVTSNSSPELEVTVGPANTTNLNAGSTVSDQTTSSVQINPVMPGSYQQNVSVSYESLQSDSSLVEQLKKELINQLDKSWETAYSIKDKLKENTNEQ